MKPFLPAIAFGSIFRLILSLTFSFGATFILAQNSIAIEPTEPTEGPCMKIMEACKTAGYSKSILNEKKSLSKDCIQPLLNGKKVEGVNADPNDIEACKIKKAEVKSKK